MEKDPHILNKLWYTRISKINQWILNEGITIRNVKFDFFPTIDDRFVKLD